MPTVQFLTTPATKSGSEDAKVVELKQQLLKTLRPTERGVSTSDEQRQAIDALIAELEPCEYPPTRCSFDNGKCISYYKYMGTAVQLSCQATCETVVMSVPQRVSNRCARAMWLVSRRKWNLSAERITKF